MHSWPELTPDGLRREAQFLDALLEKFRTDRELIERCLAPEHREQAWRELVARYQASLLRAARRALGTDGACPDRVDEIVQKLWCTLLGHANKLLAEFDEQRCPLHVYLGMLIRQRARWDCQRRRGQRRETAFSQAYVKEPVFMECPQGTMLEEFLPSLTSKERDFFLYHLLGEIGPAPYRVGSDANRWQLHRRVLAKWQAFADDQ